MSDAFIGEIRLFPFNFAPLNWVICAGQLLPISSATALYSLLGTNFGGDGRVSFGLPNLLGRTVINSGQLSGGGYYDLGQSGGVATVTVLQAQMAAHTHSFNAANVNGSQGASRNNQLAKATLAEHGKGDVVANIYTASTPNTTMAPTVVGVTGSNQAHNNMQPYLALNYCIAMLGIFPQRPD